ncbi:APC family permease [Pseudoalteromonas sp.]|uniref:APC family permease n=1 Tax=Pseudoalteromonas sp. TaxID=53249 RepID=UPI0035614C42
MKKLKPSLSLFQITFLGVGTMVGAGIYVLVGKVAGLSQGLSLWAFVAAAIIVSFSAYSHGFLAKHIPSSAGAAEYVNRVFHSPHLTLTVGLFVLLTGVVSSAALVNGFYGYLSEFILLPQWLVITGLIYTLFIMATQTVNTSVNFAVAITFLELLGLIVVIIFSKSGDFEIELQNPSWSINNIQLIMSGAFIAFYAYIGFEDMVNLAEEVEKPERNMLPAVMLALILTTILYYWVAWVALHALPINQLAQSDAPFAIMLAHIPLMSKAIIIIGLIAIMNGALVQILMGSRMLFGLSRDGRLPSLLNKLSPKHIPINATIFVVLLVWIFALALPLVTLARLTSAIILLVFTLVNVSAVVIALQKKQYTTAVIAMIGAMLSILFVIGGIAGQH